MELITRQETSKDVQVGIGREAQQVQGMVFMAKQYPRNEDLAIAKIMNACKRKTLAEESTYEFPRGGSKITGPSIRLAEAIAQYWGNIDTGIIEIERSDGVSKVLAYAWDVETNTRQAKIFDVRHERDTKKGKVKLTDERDIYEAVANYGARRMRACILGIVPGDVVEIALKECEKTLKNGASKPLPERIKDAIAHFDTNFGVTQAMLEKLFSCNSSAFTEQNLLRLGQVSKSLKDGMAQVEDFFDVTAESQKTVTASANKQTLDVTPKKEPVTPAPTQPQEVKPPWDS